MMYLCMLQTYMYISYDSLIQLGMFYTRHALNSVERCHIKYVLLHGVGYMLDFDLSCPFIFVANVERYKYRILLFQDSYYTHTT